MKLSSVLVLAAATAACVIASMPLTAGPVYDEASPIYFQGEASPIYGVTIPVGYRQWGVIAPSQEAGTVDELRVILGNAVAMKAYREGTLPFPDGSILAKLGWKRAPSVGDDAALGASQAFVPGAAMLVQIMVKDSKKYAASGGWGFGRFHDGKPLDSAQHETCFPCHSAHAASHDFVFTRFAP